MSAPMRRWSCINIGLKVIAVSDHTGALHDRGTGSIFPR